MGAVFSPQRVAGAPVFGVLFATGFTFSLSGAGNVASQESSGVATFAPAPASTPFSITNAGAYASTEASGAATFVANTGATFDPIRLRQMYDWMAASNGLKDAVILSGGVLRVISE